MLQRELLKIMKTNKIEINKVELICLIPLEEITIDTSDNMKYIMNIGDLMIYYGEELVLDKEIIMITYTLSINDV
jgi:exopolysaccharide biosynthesis predicted pyruvyltransferase EpsI